MCNGPSSAFTSGCAALISCAIHSQAAVRQWIILNGNIPLLRIRGESISDLTIQVESSAGDKPYVALSHMWADGLAILSRRVFPDANCYLCNVLWQTCVERFHGTKVNRSLESSFCGATPCVSRPRCQGHRSSMSNCEIVQWRRCVWSMRKLLTY